jgi:hypothetical protein
MPNHEQKQDPDRVSGIEYPVSGMGAKSRTSRVNYFFRTRKRTFLVGMGVGLIVAAIFLVLSLKVADPILQYNPYRWISRPHEWLMLVALVLETKIFLLFSKSSPTLVQLVVLVSVAHVLAAMLMYGVLTVLVREVVLLVKRLCAKR